MKKFLVLFLFFIGCAHNKYVPLVKESLPKVVSIQVTTIVEQIMFDIDADGKFSVEKSTALAHIGGAGVFISQRGHVLTCAHLFDWGKIQGINIFTYDGREHPGELLVADYKKDLALVKISAERYSYARLVKPGAVEVGEEVYAIGSPLGLDFTVSHGIVSSLHRDLGVKYDLTQSDTFLNPGNSGGPLFNLDGELIGINSSMLSPVMAPVFTGLGFSVSPGQINIFLTDIRRKYSGI